MQIYNNILDSKVIINNKMSKLMTKDLILTDFTSFLKNGLIIL